MALQSGQLLGQTAKSLADHPAPAVPEPSKATLNFLHEKGN
jgi:hypothetical protein